MRSNKDTFFMLLAESLVLFLLFSMIGADRDVSRFIAIVLFLSFIIAYSGSFLLNKIMDKCGDKYYVVIFLLQQLSVSTLMYMAGVFMGYNTRYIEFISIYILLSLITYNINKRLFIKEIRYLNQLIKGGGQNE